jgi:hypothetical protein
VIVEPLSELELTGDWRDACSRFAAAVRAVALARPATFRLVGLQPFDSVAALMPVERLLGVLVAERFPRSDALAVYRAIFNYARGSALAEVAGFTVDVAQPRGRGLLAALPEREFPILAGRRCELAELDRERAFVRGLEALLVGIASARSSGHDS